MAMSEEYQRQSMPRSTSGETPLELDDVNNLYFRSVTGPRPLSPITPSNRIVMESLARKALEREKPAVAGEPAQSETGFSCHSSVDFIDLRNNITTFPNSSSAYFGLSGTNDLAKSLEKLQLEYDRLKEKHDEEVKGLKAQLEAQKDFLISQQTKSCKHLTAQELMKQLEGKKSMIAKYHKEVHSLNEKLSAAELEKSELKIENSKLNQRIEEQDVCLEELLADQQSSDKTLTTLQRDELLFAMGGRVLAQKEVVDGIESMIRISHKAIISTRGLEKQKHETLISILDAARFADGKYPKTVIVNYGHTRITHVLAKLLEDHDYPVLENKMEEFDCGLAPIAVADGEKTEQYLKGTARGNGIQLMIIYKHGMSGGDFLKDCENRVSWQNRITVAFFDAERHGGWMTELNSAQHTIFKQREQALSKFMRDHGVDSDPEAMGGHSRAWDGKQSKVME